MKIVSRRANRTEHMQTPCICREHSDRERVRDGRQRSRPNARTHHMYKCYNINVWYTAHNAHVCWGTEALVNVLYANAHLRACLRRLHACA